MDPFVQLRVIRIRDNEVIHVSAASQAGSELPLSQLAGETLQVLVLLVDGGHEPGKLGDRKRWNFTVVKSDEPVA
jgi:hypothetical protein